MCPRGCALLRTQRRVPTMLQNIPLPGRLGPVLSSRNQLVPPVLKVKQLTVFCGLRKRFSHRPGAVVVSDYLTVPEVDNQPMLGAPIASHASHANFCWKAFCAGFMWKTNRPKPRELVTPISNSFDFLRCLLLPLLEHRRCKRQCPSN
jgi:hypothetical protein